VGRLRASRGVTADGSYLALSGRCHRVRDFGPLRGEEAGHRFGEQGRLDCSVRSRRLAYRLTATPGSGVAGQLNITSAA
jgi:hypothetical protein